MQFIVNTGLLSQPSSTAEGQTGTSNVGEQEQLEGFRPTSTIPIQQARSPNGLHHQVSVQTSEPSDDSNPTGESSELNQYTMLTEILSNMRTSESDCAIMGPVVFIR